MQVHLHTTRTDDEALFNAIFEMHNLEKLSVRSVPLEEILDSISSRLLNMLATKKDNIEIDPHTQYTGQRLRSLYLGEAFRVCDPQPWWLLGPNEIVFYMEELEKLHIQGAKIKTFLREPLVVRSPTKHTALTDLALLNCDVAPHTLAQILSFPKGLTHFTMKGRFPGTTGPFEYNLRPSDYIEKINQSSSAGVQYLDFDMWNADDYPDFRHLEGLKQLTISTDLYQYFIWESDELAFRQSFPVSLETLTLDDFFPTDVLFDTLLDKVEEGQLPNLRTITHRHFYPEGNQEEVDMEWEIEEFRKLGVEFSPVSFESPSMMPENDNWPCHCWIYHRTAEWYVLDEW